MKRRQFLGLIGGGTIVAAAGAIGMVATRSTRTALLPWEAAGAQYTDLRKRALSWAILAPNPHNRQPWLVDLSVADQATLYVDTEKMLPHTDPFNRQITIGLGCFIEMARLAAAQDGIAMTAELFPEGSDAAALDNRPVAIMRFEGKAEADPLFAQVLTRRSVKEPYDTERTVPSEALQAVLAAARQTRVDGNIDPDHIVEMRALTREALRIEIETPRTYIESVDLFRVGAKEVDASPDGIDFTGPIFELLSAAGQMSREALLDTSSAAFREGLKAVYANTDTAMGHLWQVTRGNTREDQIAAGADWLRIHLAATAQGLAMQPLSQALQEYPEMAEIYADVHDRFAAGVGTVQMLARIGYAAPVAPSPRWPLEAKLI
ncbi:twin-arginine translocation pathway signal protein [uncultured Sulfitobacter sp.]|uniref:Acg family FMN-binding oxidoreductase n=1 Tax=uncultured Sulfitobacter sp. TaxID=191468 RepID=UPI0026379D04|nr:twin-arginine translocation pathway signal protein [uncultured Sulfitobacter sp.]